jgi:DNA-binding NarL/FixJ family response regulator
MEQKNIVLIDDHIIVRNGLKVLIEKLGPYSIMAEFNHGIEFINALPLHFSPDLIILDLNMPEMNGDALLTHFKTSGLAFPVMILTLDSDEQHIIKLFRNGARGYLRKDCNAETLKNALESIFSTGFYHNEYLTLSLQSDVTLSRQTTQEKILGQLTEKERLFLKLVCHEKEYTYEQIAHELSVTPRTVDGYRESLFDKFNIKSKTGLVLFVLKHQLMNHL